MPRGDSVNPLLSVACDRVLRRFGDRGALSGAAFNKIITLLNRRLLEADPGQVLDIHLPRCWYLFGEEVVPRELPQTVIFEPADALVSKTVFRINQELSRPEFEGWQATRIGSELSRIEEEFGVPVDLTTLVEEVYDGAPYSMQRSFLDLRRRLRFRAELWRLDNAVEGVVRPLFNDAMANFPSQEFPELKQLTGRYKRLGRFALDVGNPAIDHFDAITSEYWQAFCYYLRIDVRGHFCVSENRLEYWRHVAPEFLSSAGPKLNVMAAELVAAFATSIDPIDRAALVGTDWGIRTSSDRTGEITSVANS